MRRLVLAAMLGTFCATGGHFVEPALGSSTGLQGPLIPGLHSEHYVDDLNCPGHVKADLRWFEMPWPCNVSVYYHSSYLF